MYSAGESTAAAKIQETAHSSLPYLVVLSHAHKLVVVVIFPVTALPNQDTLGTDARGIFVERALLQGPRPSPDRTGGPEAEPVRRRCRGHQFRVCVGMEGGNGEDNDHFQLMSAA